jgi:hypothetical protein
MATHANNNFPVHSLIQAPASALGNTQDGVLAQPYQQTLAQFQNFSWSN